MPGQTTPPNSRFTLTEYISCVLELEKIGEDFLNDFSGVLKDFFSGLRKNPTSGTQLYREAELLFGKYIEISEKEVIECLKKYGQKTVNNRFSEITRFAKLKLYEEITERILLN